MNSVNDQHALTGAYAVEALDDLERVRFERHMAECADCEQEVRSLREAAALLSGTLPAGPPMVVRQRVMDEIRTVRPLPPQPAPVEVVKRHARRFPRLVAAAAAAAVVAVGIGVVQDRDSSAPAPVAVSQQVQEASDARSQSVSLDDGSRVTLTFSKSKNRAVVVTQDMAPAPSGKVYELWFRKNGDLVPAGLMTKSGDQTVVLHGEVDGADWVGITVEPAEGSDAPTSLPVAQYNLSKSV